MSNSSSLDLSFLQPHMPPETFRDRVRNLWKQSFPHYADNTPERNFVRGYYMDCLIDYRSVTDGEIDRIAGETGYPADTVNNVLYSMWKRPGELYKVTGRSQALINLVARCHNGGGRR